MHAFLSLYWLLILFFFLSIRREFFLLWTLVFVFMFILCLADERSDGADDEDQKFSSGENIRGDTQSGCCNDVAIGVFGCSTGVSVFGRFNHDGADEASKKQDGRQSVHQECFSGERFWFVTDGDHGARGGVEGRGHESEVV